MTETHLIVIKDKGRWVTLDGIHRLAKAYMAGLKTIDTKVLATSNPYYQKARLSDSK